MNERELFNTTIALVGGAFTYLFGVWDTYLIVVGLFMAIDYTTGFLAGIMNKTLNSNVGFNGLLRKCTIMLVIIVAVLLDRLLNNGTWVFRTLVCYFYIANEGLSILENTSKCGVPWPEGLKKRLLQLKENKKEEE